MFDGFDHFALFSAAPTIGKKHVNQRFAAAGLSAGAHVAVFALLVAVRTAIPSPEPPGVTTVTPLVAPPVPGAAARPEPEADGVTAAPDAPRTGALQLPPAEVQVGGFDSSTGPLAASLGNAADGAVVVGTWNTGIATAQTAPPSGVFSPSGLFGLPGPGSGSGIGAGIGSGTVTEEAAQLLSSPAPAYTEEARQLHITGEVVLEVRVTVSGQAQFLRLVRGLAHGLDEVAIEAVRGLRFRPARRDGVPVDAVTNVTLIFKLT
jgi:TonB family protein